MRLLVVGGRQKPSPDIEQKEEWHHYERALVVALDPSTGEVAECVSYKSPPEACPDDDPSIVFKAGSLAGDRLYVCTQTEALLYDVRTWERLAYVSLPSFNDMHHVCPGADGAVILANTGLDMVLEVTWDGRVLREWPVLEEELWSRFSRTVDYRKVLTTKPHHAHPNFVFQLDNDLWVTRMAQNDAICLTRPKLRIDVGTRLHDGIVRDGRVYFTGVEGRALVADAGTLRVECDYNLNEFVSHDVPLGWCRGIALLDQDVIVVGFSRLRPTRWDQNVRWVKHKLGGSGYGLLGTRVAAFDLRSRKRCWEWDLEAGGMNAVFSIHVVEEA